MKNSSTSLAKQTKNSLPFNKGPAVEITVAIYLYLDNFKEFQSIKY